MVIPSLDHSAERTHRILLFVERWTTLIYCARQLFLKPFSPEASFRDAGTGVKLGCGLGGHACQAVFLSFRSVIENLASSVSLLEAIRYDQRCKQHYVRTKLSRTHRVSSPITPLCKIGLFKPGQSSPAHGVELYNIRVEFLSDSNRARCRRQQKCGPDRNSDMKYIYLQNTRGWKANRGKAKLWGSRRDGCARPACRESLRFSAHIPTQIRPAGY